MTLPNNIINLSGKGLGKQCKRFYNSPIYITNLVWDQFKKIESDFSNTPSIIPLLDYTTFLILRDSRASKTSAFSTSIRGPNSPTTTFKKRAFINNLGQASLIIMLASEA